MNFKWNNKEVSSTITKNLVSNREIVEQPDAFLKDGVNITFAVCGILQELMDLEETKVRVGKMLNGEVVPDEATPPGEQAQTLKKNDDRPKFKSVEEELNYLQNVVSIIKAMRQLEEAENIVKLKDFPVEVNTLVNDYLRDCVVDKVKLLEERS